MTAIQETIQKPLSEDIEITEDNDLPLRYVLFWGIILGLGLNWLATYLTISMGFVSIGIGPMAALLISKAIFKRSKRDKRKNLVMVSLSYGATRASAASISLLFLIWFSLNLSSFKVNMIIPPWLLPSSAVLQNREIFTAEWIVPLLVHYFLMIIPGIAGLILGWMLRQKFLHDEEKYPFPGVIETNTSLGVLTDEARTKGPLFWRCAGIGFWISLLSIAFIVIDFSSSSSGYIFGFFLGPVGVSLFAGGILMGNAKISTGAAISSILAYTLLSPWLVGGIEDRGFYEYFAHAVQNVYLSAILGILIGGLILGPIFWDLVKSLRTSKESKDGINEDEKSQINPEDIEFTTKTPFLIQLLGKWRYVLAFACIYILSSFFVVELGIFGDIPVFLVLIVIFWIIIVGGVINGYLVTMSVARSASSVRPPFVFDSLPIFLANGNPVSYLATPKSEPKESSGVVNALKLAQINGISDRYAMIAYISGYLAGIITTPLFALLLWHSFGIGTEQLPAPSFPVEGAILAAFMNRSISVFMSVEQILIFLAIGILLARLDSGLTLGIAFGLLFPPHMAIMLMIGGIVRFWYDRRVGKEISKEKSNTIGSGLAVGGSFVIPIMILLAVL